MANAKYSQLDHHTWEEVANYTWGNLTIDVTQKALAATVTSSADQSRKVSITRGSIVSSQVSFMRKITVTKKATVNATVSTRKKSAKLLTTTAVASYSINRKMIKKVLVDTITVSAVTSKKISIIRTILANTIATVTNAVTPPFISAIELVDNIIRIIWS